MDLAIVGLARRMFAAYDRERVCGDALTFDELGPLTRRGWVAAAIVARPDLVEGLMVGPDHWLAGVLPVIDSQIGTEATPA